jgi:2-amino-4-hydroxy-6-hydroxymethyldihydropteridine diphosphokinase
MPDAYVGVGSNQDAERHLTEAWGALRERFASARCSGIYRSAAVGLAAPDYLNMVVGFSADVGPDALKNELRALEERAGRSRAAPRGALCALDLDLLLYGRRVDPVRGLPHADVLRRAFVLAPLAELAPQLAHPLTGEPYEHAWQASAARECGITRVGALGA